MQEIHVVVGRDVRLVRLPEPDAECAPGLRWGDASLLLTPAWLAKHGHIRRLQRTYERELRPRDLSLEEDAVFCLLGGFGIRAEVAIAAFQQLRSAGLFKGQLDRAGIERELRQPLQLRNGRSSKYRFPSNRALYITAALEQLRRVPPPGEDLILRSYLLGIPGIGPKTASFIVRNHLGSDRVAIIDIHILRAGQISQLFPAVFRLPQDYYGLERRFLAFADAAQVPASILDLTIWDIMRQLPHGPRQAAASLNRRLLLDGSAVPLYHPTRDLSLMG
jgi:thermostable 8-oxoguanine DNA glycosylase